MKTRNFTQYGIFSIAVLLPFVTFFSVKLIKSGISSEPETLIYSSVIFVLLLCLLLLYKLTIILDDKSISFKMGIGLISKRYKIEDVKSCYPIKNSIVLGFGIRMLSNGWLYNVSGFKSIELHFHNKSSVVRIGTDQPEEICNAVHSIMGKQSPEVLDVSYQRKKFSLRMILLLAVPFILIAFFVYNNRETRVEVGSDGLTIKGIYGLTIPLSDIQQIDTLSSLPRISLRTNGYAFGKTNIGNFRTTDKKQIKLFIKAKNPPYILIKSKDRVPVYLNFKEKKKTIELFEKLKDWILT